MFVVSVIPFLRGGHVDSLTYFASQDFPIGSIVTVPIRGKEYQALITACTPATHAKTSVKSAHFSLRKLPPQAEPTLLPATIRRTAELLIKQYPTTPGTILYHLLPPDIRNGTRAYPTTDSLPGLGSFMPVVLTAPLSDRLRFYQSHIREQFAHRGSVVLVVPHTYAVGIFAMALSHGIEERVICFSSTQTASTRTAAYERFADTSIARLIITTPSHAYLDRVDITSIIIEESASGLYKTRTKPYLDHRDALITYAETSKRSIIIADTVPLVEHEYRRRTEHYGTADTETKRLALPAKLTLITQTDKPGMDVPFQLYATKTQTRIKRMLEGRGHVFLYGARRGLAPVVVCIDCGHIFRCPDSQTPYSLLRTTSGGTEERWFISSTSGRRVRAADTCPICGSWRLRERGIGVQQAFDEWRALAPETPTILFDTTTASTPKRAAQLIADFYSHEAAVLVGTSLALPYLTKPVTSSVVVSLDATRAIPSWRADESVLRLLVRLREISQKEVLVQTRTEADTIIEHAKSGTLERFFDDELDLREQLFYPPFTTLILLTWVLTKHTSTLEPLLQDQLDSFAPRLYSNPHNTDQSSLRHCLLRVPAGETYQAALTILRGLPPYVKIEVNPDRIV